MGENENQSEPTAGQSTNGAASEEEASTNSEPVTLEQLSAVVTQLTAQQEELETKLIGQEHRLIPAIQRVFTVYREKDDGSQAQKEKRLAALLAVVENLLRRRVAAIIVASVAGLAGSIIAILTLLEFKDQNETMAKQTALMSSQNEQIIAQNKLFQEQNRQQLVATNGQMVSALIGDLYEARKEEGIHPDSAWDVPEPLVFRILSVSEALTPYDSIIHDQTRLVSRERRELLEALVAMKVRFPLNPNPNFSFSNFINANLRGAILTRTNLTSAYFRDADFSKSILRNSDLRNANLVYANLDSVDLRNADLIKANLTFASLNSANFQDAHFYGASFAGADLTGANFRNADLRGAMLREAILIKADFRYANLFKANLSGALLNEANFQNARLVGVILDSARISSTANFQVNLKTGHFEPDSLVDFLPYAIERGAIVMEE